MPLILYLDDEEILVERLPGLLKTDYNLTITATVSIPDAFQKFHLNLNKLDAVLLDIMMSPEGLKKPENPDEAIDPEDVKHGRETGLEIVRQFINIQNKYNIDHNTNLNIPIVIFSVVSDPKIKKALRDLGITHFVTKPAEIDTVANMLISAIK